MSSRFVQLQEDVYQALLSNNALVNINIVQYRKLRLASEIEWSTLWLTPRNGRSGAGVLIEMPTFEVEHPNLPGPERELVLPVVVIEEPNINYEPASGTLLSAEELAEKVLGLLHGYIIEGIGALYADKKAITPAEEFQGLVAYRVSLRMRAPRDVDVRVALPTITEEALQVTLACATAEAEIWLTEDGTFPGPSNPGARKYVEPFDLGGEVLRWAAYKEGMLGSHVGQAKKS